MVPSPWGWRTRASSQASDSPYLYEPLLGILHFKMLDGPIPVGLSDAG